VKRLANARVVVAVALAALGLVAACTKPAKPPETVTSVPVASLPGHESLAVDTTPKEESRLVPPEAYLRTYLHLFGGTTPLEAQKRARADGTFDSWDDYFAALGFPDYRIDMPRGTQTNALMVATFERLGVSLCDRAVLHDLAGKTPPPVKDRTIFSFDVPKGTMDRGEFAWRFDVLHRRFLGYPAMLAETNRTERFHELYATITARHSAAGAAKSRFTPEQAGWAAVCYGLVRHPEFQLYLRSRSMNDDRCACDETLPHPGRRDVLRLLGAGAAAAGLASVPGLARAEATSESPEMFIFIHASGGWDVTLWADPRNEKRGIIAPATTENTDPNGVRLWVDAPFDEGIRTFKPIRPQGSNLTFGPGIGELSTMFDRLCIVNGLAMNTVSHPDGSAFSTTGRHLVGGRAPSPSIDTAMANEFGKEQLFPAISVSFPSFYVGDNLDRRVVPLVIGNIGSITRTLSRSQAFDTDDDRDLVTAMLSNEAHDLATKAAYPDVLNGMGLQLDLLRRMLKGNLQDVFSAEALKKNRPELNYKGRFHGNNAVNAAFAVEAMKRNLVRCVSFALGGFDTHANNYRTHALLQQEVFDMIATLVRIMDVSPHPTKQGAKLSDHTHIVVVSDFCRTPQINRGMGRDHYPNNSALVISPRFKGNFSFGQADSEQLLPVATKDFKSGKRAIAPPDLITTLFKAVGVEPRKYLRDGEVVTELLRA
jgi:hypothetical protein